MKPYAIFAAATAAIVAQPAAAGPTFTFSDLTSGSYLLTYTVAGFADPHMAYVYGGITYYPSVPLSLTINSGTTVDVAIPNSNLHYSIGNLGTTTTDATIGGMVTETRTVPIVFDSGLAATLNSVATINGVGTVLFDGVSATFNSPLDDPLTSTTPYYRITNVSLTSALPEPGSWGLMIAGFALIGAALRRRGHLARNWIASADGLLPRQRSSALFPRLGTNSGS